jgi:NADH-quinone oxidoreductase subunit H
MVSEETTWQVKTIADRAAAALPDDVWLAAGYLLLGLAAVAGLMSALAIVLIYVERKIAGHFQCRTGPMRVGWHGTLQTVADTIKLLFKEDVVPARADRMLHFLAPLLCMLTTVLAILVLPMSPVAQVADVSIGVLYLTAIGGFGVLGMLVGGWSSNNKWSLLGGMRAGAQIISYEISVTLALLVVVLFAGTLQLSQIVQSQAEGWWIWRAHGVGFVAFVIFMIAAVAELNRPPFDIPEGESELTAGFHTEYSGMRFAFFHLAEFVNMFVMSAFAVTLFLGGWMPFQIGNWTAFNEAMALIPPGLWFAGKTAVLVFAMMWFRWTFPRLRMDQLMNLEWKVLMPVGFANLILAAAVLLSNFYFFPVY